MRIVGIFMFIFLGVTSIIGLAALDDTWFSFILGVCAYLGGLVSGVLLFIDRAYDADSYYKAFLTMQDQKNKVIEEKNKFEKVIRLLNKEIIKLKSEV
tara:strand:+ start:2608 stop:2901 length:294 start_codon:yes stop_codon:yes gene_type:complete